MCTDKKSAGQRWLIFLRVYSWHFEAVEAPGDFKISLL
jgi:hypothetical protein